MYQQIEVRPSLPEPIGRLEELAGNLWFSWNADARELFFRLDRELWRKVGHNPNLFLRRISQKKLTDASEDRTYLVQYNRVMAAFDVYESDEHTWYSSAAGDNERGVIAYFSAEFGIHESLPIFSGGLGVLAGDHCKSASDMGLPFVGVGLLYRKGYFIQHIDSEGQQHATYEELDFSEVSVRELTDADGKPLLVRVELAGRTVWIKVWQAPVGRIPLYLLDTDIPENEDADRLITHQLYGGGQENRICQEIVLGIGGVRALDALGITPSVWHMNEGHSAFLGLERIRELVREHNLTIPEATEVVRSRSVFTTHTPVAAGHDAFPLALMDTYFHAYWASLGMDRHQFMELGLEVSDSGEERYSMTVLALTLSGRYNGVSRLHGDVSSEMWKDRWPGVPAAENPINYVTNGVHTMSWLAPEMMGLFDQHLGIQWRANLTNAPFWEAVDQIPDGLLWGVHQNLKRRMIERVRERCVEQRIRNGEGAAALNEARQLLDPEALTIGFARRFATYKRATLLFHDLDRLKALLTDPERPVQFVFAGKAHPADHPGQELLKHVYALSQEEPFKGRIVFVEGYDIAIARYLVSGVDVWLNTPRRPCEASGTSGMKVCMNGGINFSILDGWWCEAADHGVNGWSIGDERECHDEELLNQQDATTLYQLLEESIVDTYYRRNSQGVPDDWIRVAKASIKSVPPVFNTDRMVGDYARNMYFPAIAHGRRMSDAEFTKAKELSAWKAHVHASWHQVRVVWDEQPASARRTLVYGESVEVAARVTVGALSAGDLRVEAYISELNADGHQVNAVRIPLHAPARNADGDVRFTGEFTPPDSGRYTVTVRATPQHTHLVHPHELGLICWLTEEPRGRDTPHGATQSSITEHAHVGESDGGTP